VTGTGLQPEDGAVAAVGRRQRKKHETRERILDEASQLIVEQGLAATTVDQIAERADIAQATFFNYFPTKAALIEALVGRAIDMWNGVIDQAHETAAPAADKIATLFRVTADLTQGQHRLLRDLIVETARAPAEAPSSLTLVRAFFRDDLAEGQARGEVRVDRDATTLADCVLGLYVSVLIFWTTEAEYPVVARLHDAAQMALELISPDPAGRNRSA
jgi:AcrR family transcriptional regulator